MKKDTLKKSLQLFWSFLKIGAITFGGGLAMVSVISREVCDKKKWINEKEMGDIVIVAESTPGAIAVNTATYVGYKTAGVLGSAVATLGVMVVPLVLISVIYLFFDAFRDNKWVNAAFKGIRALVIVLLIEAAAKLIRPMTKNAYTIICASVVALITIFTDFDSIYLIIAGGVIGISWFVAKALFAKKKARLAGENSPVGSTSGASNEQTDSAELSSAQAEQKDEKSPETNVNDEISNEEGKE